tara:strand:+ start:4179 stop:6524 length:2346 start_codon:yes stop_codon:yes gene_type:complete
MKHVLIIFLICFLIIEKSDLFSEIQTETITNPQSMMVGAKSISLGLNPAISGDISHSILNPATNADINQYPFSITAQSLLQEFNYLSVSGGVPFVLKFKRNNEKYHKEIGINIAYGNVSLNKIPETISIDGLPYQIGSFSAGYHLVHVGLGTNFYEKFTINKISFGTALKSTTYYVGNSNSSTIGVDFGAIATQYIDYKFISSIDIAAVIHNALSPSMTIKKTENIAILPFSIGLGSKVNFFNDRLSILSSINEIGVSLGTEYEIEKGVFVRGSSNFNDLKIGLGIDLDNIPTGVVDYAFKGRFDFNYTQSAFPMDKNGTYVFSLTSLGRSVPKKPEILFPSKPLLITDRESYRFSGVGPKNSTIRIYNNDQIYKSIMTNKYGNWNIDPLPINEGENEIYIKAYNIEKDMSLKSNSVTVISDTIPPKLDIKIFPENAVLSVKVQSNEILANISGEIDDQKIRLRKVKNKKDNQDSNSKNQNKYLVPTEYQARAELPLGLRKDDKKGFKGSPPPKTMSQLTIFATDESGNSMEFGPVSFFGSISFPIDKHVHYSDTLIVIGNASEILQDIYINKEKVTLDSEDRFSIPIELDPGKNVIETTFETHNNKTLQFNTRVLRLVSYPDMNSKVKGRREIEFLSTLKLLHGDNDGNFYPTKIVTREFITKLMVLSMFNEDSLADVDSNLFSDVPFDHPSAHYIQAAINEGLVYAFPDGTFKPNQELTLTEVIYLMSNAGIIDYEEVEDSNQLISRAQLAEFLAYTPKYERKIEKLIDWESGYDINEN